MGSVTTMDFFGAQEQARKRTSLLVVYYAVAVALIIATVYLAVLVTMVGVEAKVQSSGDGARARTEQRWWNPELFVTVAGATLLVVLVGTLFKVRQLSSGGEAVATSLGGRPLEPGSAEPDERKVLNVVEEMAIASGIPVPRVFMLDGEPGINAFAAGFSPSDAVIGVTRGCAQTLTRDELQGVIAHEFSHILNGDMRLNIRLMGVLHGILCIALIGYGVMRTGAVSGRSRSRDSKGGGGIALLGFLLMIIGYVGVFFAKLIKSAVSRQREFLADASAVQFTRNPDGIAGALKRIGGFAGGSRLKSAHAEEASHLFFSNGVASAFLNLTATHPPLPERIRRIDPAFDGEMSVSEAQGPPPVPVATPVSGFAASPSAGSSRALRATPVEVADSVGAPTAQHLAYATDLVAAIPSALRDAAHTVDGAEATVYALLLDDSEAVRAPQLQRLESGATGDVFAGVERAAPSLGVMDRGSRLPLLDLAIGTLKGMSAERYAAFRENVEALVKADETVDLSEYVLQRMLIRHLDPVFGKVARRPPQVYALKGVLPSLGALLSCLAYWGADDEAEAVAAYRAAAEALDGDDLPPMSRVDDCGLAAVDTALERLDLLIPKLKRGVVEACVRCIASDGEVTQDEAELLRAIGDSLDCPIPPLLPGRMASRAA